MHKPRNPGGARAPAHPFAALLSGVGKVAKTAKAAQIAKVAATAKAAKSPRAGAAMPSFGHLAQPAPAPAPTATSRNPAAQPRLVDRIAAAKRKGKAKAPPPAKGTLADKIITARRESGIS